MARWPIVAQIHAVCCGVARFWLARRSRAARGSKNVCDHVPDHQHRSRDPQQPGNTVFHRVLHFLFGGRQSDVVRLRATDLSKRCAAQPSGADPQSSREIERLERSLNPGGAAPAQAQVAAGEATRDRLWRGGLDLQISRRRRAQATPSPTSDRLSPRRCARARGSCPIADARGAILGQSPWTPADKGETRV